MTAPTIPQMLDAVLADEIAQLQAVRAAHPLTDAQRIAYCDHLALKEQARHRDPIFPEAA
ncbi:MAG: hypothetical protein EOP24_26155 [Hyphomicrobiales bacterium]|nr:MAG: hypothetical protein EOP24_26155 [Hyphomicrobiales bacterium]